MAKTWFANWFDTEYYHALYGNKRNDEEASIFIHHLVEKLKLNPPAFAWDMSCGKGRHVRAFKKLGFKVLGTDLSPSSIESARKFSEEKINYAVHDMRHILASNYFDLVGNFFTSFGYFKSRHDDVRIFKSAHTALKPGGVFVLDFFNTTKLLDFKEMTEEKILNGVQYHIHKYVENNTVYKEIKVMDGEKEMYHKEQVYLYSDTDLQKLLTSVGFQSIQKFGNYKLESFDSALSERCLLIAKK
jgi:SAM-dependent methyltransferase